ncbi:EAL domain-containing protein [Lentzea tibetensis]|uniref:EAL domain-containing protein n=1 Tax=Lentzea tibetensis TaxID=2591470 RepID=A0A563EFK1_9PSEU|nr:EAL domain-containing protein [Lentzea tibetensis]TWP44745.1 EAL domain-containing protein [Lentzea tibetensis]
MQRSQLAHVWARAISSTAYVPLSPAEIEAYLYELLELLPTAPETVAERMVAIRLTGPDSLRRTIEVLAPEYEQSVIATLSSQYAFAMRLDAFDQQEQIKVALMASKRRVERVLKVSEARFREVFTSSALGIAITDFAGVCVEANDTLAEIVGHGSLIGRSLFDFFHPADAERLGAAYRRVRNGVVDRFREQRKLIRADGEPVWVYLAGSLLHDADGVPTHHVTMIEDISELYLLQKNLDHQLLHDSLTGLPNRQHFVTQLEKLHGQGPITLYHLDLDAFSVVNNGLGHAAGDTLLRSVAQRLHAVASAQNAVLARIGGGEFGIVCFANEVPEMVSLIQEELTEPTYVDGHGLALSVSIGVVDRPPGSSSVSELLRAANSALRQAQQRGMRQWALYDPHEDAVRRGQAALAAALPGAVESGELSVDYSAVLDLPSREVIGLAARLRWGDLGHAQTLALAEETGISLPIGQWLLHESCAQAAQWLSALGERAPMLHVALSPLQSRDEDLVAHVKRTLDETGLPASQLRVALDIGSVLAGDDNVHVLADNGIGTGVDGFHGGYHELALLSELPVRAVVVRAAVAAEGTVLHAAMGDVVAAVHRLGVRVVADGVGSDGDADWWTSVGADAVHGLMPALSAAEMTEYLAN